VIGEGAKRAPADCAGRVVGRSRNFEAAVKGVENGGAVESGHSFGGGFGLGEAGSMTDVRCMSVFGRSAAAG
jgi:hypothetical protein